MEQPMAWEKTHKIQVKNLGKKQIWKVWQDVNQWHHWDTDIEFARLDQPFAVGSQFLLKPKGGPKFKIKLVKVEKDTAFTDVTKFPLAKMYGIHEMRETKEGLELSHTVRIEGLLSFLWKKIIAEKVAAGLEEQTEKMVQQAREVK
jgi:hypothetical protein